MDIPVSIYPVLQIKVCVRIHSEHQGQMIQIDVEARAQLWYLSVSTLVQQLSSTNKGLKDISLFDLYGNRQLTSA